MSYLADIFSSLNELCLKLQGQSDDVFQNWKHILTFQKSLKLWLARLRSPKPSHYMFPTVFQHIEENDVTDTQVKHLTGLIVTHLLVALINNFEHYLIRVCVLGLKCTTQMQQGTIPLFRTQCLAGLRLSGKSHFQVNSL